MSKIKRAAIALMLLPVRIVCALLALVVGLYFLAVTLFVIAELAAVVVVPILLLFGIHLPTGSPSASDGQCGPTQWGPWGDC